MARRPLSKAWQPDEIARLIALADAGATVLRAAAALKRSSTSVQKKARELGKPLIGVREVRAAMRRSE